MCCTDTSKINCSSRVSYAGHDIIWRRAAAITGRPYLARAAEEHSGPHAPWFWQGEMQGGGVLNDMMCHSVEVGRYLLTPPGAPRGSIRLKKITAHIASLKWSRAALCGGPEKPVRPGRWIMRIVRPRTLRAPRWNTRMRRATR